MSEAEREVWHEVRQSFLQAKQRKSGSKETPKHYASILDAFFGPDFVKSPADVSQQECLAFITAPCYGRIHHGEPAAVSTQAKRLAILKSWYAFCQHYTLPSENSSRPRRLLPIDFVAPTEGIEPGKRPRSYRALSMEEIAAIWRQIPGDTRGLRDRSFLTFALLTGLRRSSLERLRWKDLQKIVFESGREGVTFAYVGKGNKRRVKELPSLAYTTLLDSLRSAGRLETMQPDSPLWVCIPCWKGLGGRYTPETARGQEPSRQAGRYTAETPVSGQALNEALQRYAAAARIDKPVSLHGLRHSIARCLYRQCKDPLKIMAFLDHSDLSVTTQYLFELEQVEADEEQRKMEARFSFLATGRESEVSHAR